MILDVKICIWIFKKNQELILGRSISFEEIFLKTIIPSRKFTRIYLGDKL